VALIPPSATPRIFNLLCSMMDNELPKVSEFLKQEGIEVNHLQQ
jgi:hypothetical protein